MGLSDFPRPFIAVVLLGIHGAGHDNNCRGQTWDLPVPACGASVRARGLRPRGVLTRLAKTVRPVLPLASSEGGGTPK